MHAAAPNAARLVCHATGEPVDSSADIYALGKTARHA
jgi:hypothetical protein